VIVSVERIEVKERIREDVGESEIKELMDSLLALGQLQPIVVRENGDGKYELVAGERRLIACKRLGEDNKSIKGHDVHHIWAELRDSVAPHVQLQMEFDENMKRKDFTYIEKARFIRKFHETMEAQAKDAGAEWSNELTAVSLRLSPASISHYLRIEEAVKTDPMIAKAVTMDAAVKRMKLVEKQRARQIEVRDNSAESYKSASDMLRRGDALQLIKELPDNSIDCINFDPPWGDDTGHKSNENWDGFDDDTETSDNIIDSMLPELYRVLKNDRIMIYWYRAWAYNDMVARLEGAGFNVKFTRTPCIWFKPDKVSDQNRFPEKQLIESYETFLLARKGDPVFYERNWQNVFPYNRVPLAALIHPTEKPIDLCTSLLKLLTIPGELVLDPTAGSAAILHAALLSGRKVLGFELSESIHGRAVTRLAECLKALNRVELKS